MPGMDKAERVINGTHGELWLDSEYVGECYGCQAKIAYNKEDVFMAGSLYVGSKVKSLKGTGSLKLYKTSSRMATLLSEKIQRGETPIFTVISKLNDPDAYGAERVALYNVSFDDLTIVDWERDALGKVEAPFTFMGHEYLDLIEVQ